MVFGSKCVHIKGNKNQNYLHKHMNTNYRQYEFMNDNEYKILFLMKLKNINNYKYIFNYMNLKQRGQCTPILRTNKYSSLLLICILFNSLSNLSTHLQLRFLKSDYDPSNM